MARRASVQPALGLAPGGDPGSFAATLTEIEDEPKDWVHDVTVEIIGAGVLTIEYETMPVALPPPSEETKEKEWETTANALNSRPPSQQPPPPQPTPPSPRPVSTPAAATTAEDSGMTKYPWEQLEQEEEEEEQQRGRGDFRCCYRDAGTGVVDYPWDEKTTQDQVKDKELALRDLQQAVTEASVAQMREIMEREKPRAPPAARRCPRRRPRRR